MPATLFISDLHLDADRPAIAGLFLKFLEHTARHAEALYILGDLFEFWIGDDNDSEFNRSICDGLKKLTQAGTPVYVMHGNRDFLLARQFEAMSGSKLLPDPSVISLYGRSILLMHGDTLCTDDVEYMAFREQVRNPETQKHFLEKSLVERAQIANQIRGMSMADNSGKPEDIMDANTGEILRILGVYEPSLLIHGHTHRPGTHVHRIGDREITRIVLGDWYEHGSVLEITGEGFDLKTIPTGA